MLQGKLTYLVAGVGLLFGIVALISGQFVSQTEAVGIIWSSLAIFGIRRAIQNQ